MTFREFCACWRWWHTADGAMKIAFIGLMLKALGIVCMALALFLSGCTHEAPLPPVPPAPDDLSSWTVPELVAPPPEPPAAPPPPPEEKPTAAEKVYAYTPGTVYAAPVAMGMPLDIMLERGEHVRNLTDGDRTPVEPGHSRKWEVKEGADGLGETLRHHVFVTASEPGLSNGLVITTTRRAYHLTVTSVPKSPVRVVRWQYPPGPAVPPTPKTPGLLPDPMEPAKYHAGYDVAVTGAQRPEWIPRVYDDGRKTFLLFSPVVLYGSMPLVREMTVQGPAVLNTRQIGPVVIIDKLIRRLELRFGVGEHADIVTVTRANLKTITCPSDPECPAWPQEPHP